MIFVDTAAWIAYRLPADEYHTPVRIWMHQNRQPLFTTDYIVDETLTLLRPHGESRRAILIGEFLFSGELAELYYLTEADIEAAWSIFKR